MHCAGVRATPNGERFASNSRPPAKPLHDGDADVLALAETVQLRAVGVDPAQGGVIFFGEQRVDVLAGGQHIKGRVDAEENHLHIAGLRCLHGDHGVV